MADVNAIEDFPRNSFLDLLREAQGLLVEEQDRKNLVAGLGLAAAETQRQHEPLSVATAAGTRREEPIEGLPVHGPRVEGTPIVETVALDIDRLSSPARFAAGLVDLVAQPAHLDAAITLARRAINYLDETERYRWRSLVEELETMQEEFRSGEGAGPDLGEYRGWIGFECRHEYSLADRFFGREEYLEELDTWTTTGDDIAVRCLSALGGGGKTALAWQWLKNALPSLRQQGYEGAFWCSFYEKNFNFDEFLRRALAFAGRTEEEDVRRRPRPLVEEQLLKVMRDRRFVFVLDGLERLMNGYAVVARRAIDLEGTSGALLRERVSAADRRMIDPRDGAFLRQLAELQASKVLITTRLVPAELTEEEGTTPVPHVAVTELPGLTPSDAAALWSDIIPSAEVTEQVQALFRVCGYHPLVISILARSVAEAGGTWDDWLRSDAHRDFDPRSETSEAGVRAHVVGICMRDMSEESLDILGVLTTSGKPMKVGELTEVLLLGSTASGDRRWTTEHQVVEELENLLRAGMIGRATPPDEATEYDVHPVVRGAAFNLLTDPKRERFLDYALSEFAATPDRGVPDDLDSLQNAIGVFRRVARTKQLDRAWEMFASKLYYPLYLNAAYQQVLELYGLLLPDREALQLLPLTSRRAQADAANVLGHVLRVSGKGRESDTLSRWCGAIRLQIGDEEGFLTAAHERAWQSMYEGRLFDTEYSLRAIRLEALAYGAYLLEPAVNCWIGIILALRGDEKRAQSYFDAARGRTHDYRWWAQGLAEGLAYLESADEALEVLDLLEANPDRGAASEMQIAWEQLTAGMAHFQAGNHERAWETLAEALGDAREAGYAIIECFALPYLAEISLQRGEIAQAEGFTRAYFEKDPDSTYRLSATDAWRVRARCEMARGDVEAAQAHAGKAYQLAACDGPPFVYKTALSRAQETLREAGAYVPPTWATLDVLWREQLAHLTEQERKLQAEISRALVAAEPEADAIPSFEDALATLQDWSVIKEASAEDRGWWDGVTGSQSAIKIALSKELDERAISLRSFREAFETSPHESFTVVFHQLAADRIIHPHTPAPVRGLSQEELQAWLSDADAHEQALETFLKGVLAHRLARPYKVHDFDDVDITAFLKDHKRRIAVDATPVAKQWWDQLESCRAPGDMLVLAECVLLMPAELSEVVDEISVNADCGLDYAFRALLTRRAVERLKSKTISRAEGWSRIEVLLRLQDVKLQLGWTKADLDAKRFWEELERSNEHQVTRVLQLAEELARRDATIDEYHRAYLLSDTENIQASLAYLDYLQHRAEPWDISQPWPTGGVAERWAYGTLRPEFTDASKLSPEQVAGWTKILLQRVGWREPEEEQQAWWTKTEKRITSNVALRLLQELDSRRSNLAALQKAEVDGDTENLVAALAYADYKAITAIESLEAEQRALELNRVGNSQYNKGQYREAVQSYEAAIEARSASVYFTNLAGAWERVPDLSQAAALSEAVTVLRRGVQEHPEADDLQRALEAAGTRLRLSQRGGLPAHAGSIGMLPVVTPIVLEVAADLIPLAERSAAVQGTLMWQIEEARTRVRTDTGVKVPGIRWRGNETDLPDGTYIIMLDETPVVSGSVRLDRVLTTVSESELLLRRIAGEASANPVDGSSANWIRPEDTPRVGEPVWDACEYVARHLEAVLRSSLSMFAGFDTVAGLLEATWSSDAHEILASPEYTVLFARMAKLLIDDGVPLVEMEAICAMFLRQVASDASLGELIISMRGLPQIRPKLPGNRPGQFVLGFDRSLEEELELHLEPFGDGFALALEPETTQEILTTVRIEVGTDQARRGAFTLVVRNPQLRRHIRELVELEFPEIPVLALSEVEEEVGPVLITLTLEEEPGWIR